MEMIQQLLHPEQELCIKQTLQSDGMEQVRKQVLAFAHKMYQFLYNYEQHTFCGNCTHAFKVKMSCADAVHESIFKKDIQIEICSHELNPMNFNKVVFDQLAIEQCIAQCEGKTIYQVTYPDKPNVEKHKSVEKVHVTEILGTTAFTVHSLDDWVLVSVSDQLAQIIKDSTRLFNNTPFKWDLVATKQPELECTYINLVLNGWIREYVDINTLINWLNDLHRRVNGASFISVPDPDDQSRWPVYVAVENANINIRIGDTDCVVKYDRVLEIFVIKRVTHTDPASDIFEQSWMYQNYKYNLVQQYEAATHNWAKSAPADFSNGCVVTLGELDFENKTVDVTIVINNAVAHLKYRPHLTSKELCIETEDVLNKLFQLGAIIYV